MAMTEIKSTMAVSKELAKNTFLTRDKIIVGILH